ncbi:PAS domain S-box protein [Bacteroidota bacterium]
MPDFFKTHIKYTLIIISYLLFVFSSIGQTQKSKYAEIKKIENLLLKSENIPVDSINLSKALLVEALLRSKEIDDKFLISKSYITLGKVYYSLNNFEEAIINFNSGLLLARKISNDSLQEIAIANLGIINGHRNNPELAKKYFLELLAIGEKTGKINIIAKANNNLGVVNENTGSFGAALIYYQTSLKLWETLKDTLRISSCFNNLGNTYYRLGDFKKSLDFHFQSLEYRKLFNDNRLIANSYNNIGSIYEVLDDYEKAIEYHKESLLLKKQFDANPKELANSYNNLGNVYRDLEQYDTALYYHHKALKIWKELNNKKAISMSLNNLAVIYKKVDKYEKALNFYLEAIKLSKSINAKYDLAFTYNNIAQLLFEQKKFSKALVYINHAKSIGDDIKALELLSISIDLLAKTNFKLGNYREAASNFRLSKELNDSLFNIVKVKEIEKLNILYKATEELKNAPFVKEQKPDYKTLLVKYKFELGIIVFFTICLFIVFIVIRIRRNKKYKPLKDDYSIKSSWFFAILEATNDGIVIFDSKGNIFKHNQKFEKIWNVDPGWDYSSGNKNRFDQIISQIINKEDFIYQTKHILNTSLQRQHLILELLNGQSYEMYALAFDIQGEKNGTLWSFRDLTDRRKAIDALKISQQRYQMVVERSLNGIVILQDFKVKFINNAFSKHMGYSKEEIMNNSYEIIIPKENINEIKARYEARLKGEQIPSQYELGLTSKSGELIYFEVDASLIDYESKPAVLAFFRNISKRKIVEDELRKLSSAIEYSPVSVVITDDEGKIEYVNPNFTKLTGYSLTEVLGENPRLLKSGTQDKRFYKDLWDTIKSGETWHGEFHNRKKNGELYWESASISPIINNGKITHFVAVKNNVTELKLANEELLKREKELKDLVATKDKFFSIVAHDLRNPFHSLIGFTDLILNNPEKISPEKILDYIEIISKTAKSGYNLLENLLHWAQSQSGKLQYSPEKINIKEITNEVIELSNTSLKNKDLKAIVEINDNILAFADKNTITTVIRNLISNAIKYSRNKGKIEISASTQNKNVQVSIKDYGIGIEKSAIDKLFKLDTNYSTPGTNEEKGTGLGLILCKDFVENNGGKIWVESDLNKGTCFYFTIPLD